MDDQYPKHLTFRSTTRLSSIYDVDWTDNYNLVEARLRQATKNIEQG